MVHNKDPAGLSFYAIDTINRPWRGANMTQKISQNETKWIFELHILRPLGLNVELDLNCFITDYEWWRSLPFILSVLISLSIIFNLF